MACSPMPENCRFKTVLYFLWWEVWSGTRNSIKTQTRSWTYLSRVTAGGDCVFKGDNYTKEKQRGESLLEFWRQIDLKVKSGRKSEWYFSQKIVSTKWGEHRKRASSFSGSGALDWRKSQKRVRSVFLPLSWPCHLDVEIVRLCALSGVFLNKHCNPNYPACFVIYTELFGTLLNFY